jgi:Uri superfamily endonuclease
MIADWLCMMQGDEFLKRSGAYILLIQLNDEFEGHVGHLGDITLPAGEYFYFGSARGPGGMAARIKHHIRSDKKLHWHLDRLTFAGRVVEFLAVPNGDECDLRGKVMALKNLVALAMGFGSSDYRRCPAHLLAIPDDGSAQLRKLAETVGGNIYSAGSLLPTTAAQPSTV